MKKLIALLLVLAMAFSMMAFLTACSDNSDSKEETEETEKETEAEETKETEEETEPEETEEETEPEETKQEANPLVGEWSGQADMAMIFNMMFEMMLGEELASYLTLDSFEVAMTFIFEEDGSYTMVFDEDSFTAAMQNASETWIEGYYGLIEYTIEAEGLDMTAEEYAQETFGMSVEEYIEDGLVGSMDATAFETYGEYELDEDKLYLDGDPDYYTINLNGDELVIAEYSGGDIEGDLFADVVFVRQ